MKAYCAAGLSVGLILSVFSSVTNADGEPKGADIFAERILPIFKSRNPSSCTQCPLAGKFWHKGGTNSAAQGAERLVAGEKARHWQLE